MRNALVVDDEPAICQCFQTLLTGLDCRVDVAASAEEGLLLAEQTPFDVIVLDVRLPGRDGLSSIPAFRRLSDAAIIVMTAHGNLSTAVAAVENEAFDYLPKPFELDHVTDVLKRALAEARVAPSQSSPASLASEDDSFVGNSAPMQRVFRQVAMAAQHDAPVLVTGESGTGKELVAKAIHRHSPQRSGPLVSVHLASLNEAVLERELFGHTAGAFTGAHQYQAGVIEQADGGTLFLDEIGETPMSVQVKLLRTIETGEFFPVGASVARRSNFRLIAATNRSMDDLRSAEHFRTDFYFRLATLQIHLPPLRDRIDDIPDLAACFLRQTSADTERRFSADALGLLRQLSYPGNVRELRNIVVRAAAETSESVIGTHAIRPDEETQRSPEQREANDLQSAVRRWAEQSFASESDTSLSDAVELLESEMIRVAMNRSQGNRTAAALLLGIHRETLRDRLEKYGIAGQ